MRALHAYCDLDQRLARETTIAPAECRSRKVAKWSQAKISNVEAHKAVKRDGHLPDALKTLKG
jgi:hypothetical protein